MRDDRRHQKIAVVAYLDARAAGCDPAGDVDGPAFIATRRQSGRLTSSIDTTDLHRYPRDAGQAQHQHHDQRGDRQGRFHGAGTGTSG